MENEKKLSERSDEELEAMAIQEFRIAIELNPRMVMAHYGLAVCLHSRKEYKEAEKEYRETIRLEPEFRAAHVNLGFLLKDLGIERYEEAIKELKEGLYGGKQNE